MERALSQDNRGQYKKIHVLWGGCYEHFWRIVSFFLWMSLDSDRWYWTTGHQKNMEVNEFSPSLMVHPKAQNYCYYFNEIISVIHFANSRLNWTYSSRCIINNRMLSCIRSTNSWKWIVPLAHICNLYFRHYFLYTNYIPWWTPFIMCPCIYVANSWIRNQTLKTHLMYHLE